MAKKTTSSSSKTVPKTPAPAASKRSESSKKTSPLPVSSAPKKAAASKRPASVPPEDQEISDDAFLTAPLPPQAKEVLPLLISCLVPWYGSKAAEMAANLWTLYALLHPLKFRTPEPHAAAFVYAYLQSFSESPPTLDEVADQFEIRPTSFRSLLPAFSAFLSRHSARKLTRFSVLTLTQIAIEQKKPLFDLRPLLLSLLPPPTAAQTSSVFIPSARLLKDAAILFENGRFFAFAVSFLPPLDEEEDDEDGYNEDDDSEDDDFYRLESLGDLEEGSPFWGLHDFLDQTQIEKLTASPAKPSEISVLRGIPPFDLSEDFAPPQPLPLGDLRRLPRFPEVWLGGICAAPAHLQGVGSSYLFLWIHAQTGEPVMLLPFGGDMPKEAILMSLVIAMTKPPRHPPHRPRCVRLINPSWIPSFRKAFQPFEIQCRHADKEDLRIFEESARLLARYPSSPLGREADLASALQALPSALVSTFFQTAAALAEKEFFLVILEDQIVQVDFRSWDGPSYAVSSIGEAAESVGLLLFSSLRDFLRFRQASLGDEPSRLFNLDLSFISLNYTPLEQMDPSIQKEQKRKKWKLSKQKLFPTIDLFQASEFPKTAALSQYEQAIVIAEAFQFLIDKHADLFQQEMPPQPQTLHFQSPTFPDRPPVVLRIPHPAFLDPSLDSDETPSLPAPRPSHGSSFDA